MPKLTSQLESRPRIYDDYEAEEGEDEYVDSDSEDDLPTHEIEAIEDDIMEISTRQIKNIP